MSPKSRAAALLIVLSLLLATGCSKKSSPTRPPGGGTTTEPFNSGVFSSTSPVKVFVHTFNTEGTFSYNCGIHDVMTGSIMCAVGMPESTTVTITNNVFTPSLAHVRPGGYIKWVAGGGDHSVTRP